ncbi:MAG: UxaA family hydrolase, partial [Planctomycetia bacterium]
MTTSLSNSAVGGAILLRDEDDVGIAVAHLSAGAAVTVGGRTVVPTERIPMGHKFALAAVKEGDPVRKYGQIIGFATKAIAPGAHVHTHNIACDVYERDYAHATETPTPTVANERLTFDGYLRPDGRVGTRNYVAIVSTVNCSSHTAKLVARRLEPEIKAKYPNVDGVI